MPVRSSHYIFLTTFAVVRHVRFQNQTGSVETLRVYLVFLFKATSRQSALQYFIRRTILYSNPFKDRGNYLELTLTRGLNASRPSVFLKLLNDHDTMYGDQRENSKPQGNRVWTA